MSDQLEFDQSTADFMETFYRSADIERRRASVLALLDVQPGDAVLDLGSGPGFYVAILADLVGSQGSVIGIDPSQAMLETGRGRSAAQPQAEYREGTATSIPVDDGSIDRALSVQVLEYVEDVPAALAGLYRALKPGGRLVVWDIDWATVSWFSDEPDRMARVLTAWDEHLAHPSLPQALRAHLHDAGFQDVAVEGHAYVNTTISSDNYSTGLIRFVSQYVPGRNGCSEDLVAAWRDEQTSLGAAGRFFFAFMQFGLSATRPR